MSFQNVDMVSNIRALTLSAEKCIYALDKTRDGVRQSDKSWIHKKLEVFNVKNDFKDKIKSINWGNYAHSLWAAMPVIELVWNLAIIIVIASILNDWKT